MPSVVPAIGPSTPRSTPLSRRRFAPSGSEWLAMLLIVALPLGFGRKWLSMDGDPGRHIRVGETILRSGLFYRDPFSFTKAGAPFIPYEWLSEVLTALSVRIAALPGLLVLTGIVLALTYAVVWQTLSRRGVSPIVAVAAFLLVLAMGVLHWLARPHVFTMLGAALAMVLADRAADGAHSASPPGSPSASRWHIWWAAWPALPLFACWANLHGGFLYGLFLLAAIIVGDRLEMLSASGAGVAAWRETLTRHAALLGAAVCGTLLTPSGPRLYLHTLRYLGDTYLVNGTQEYMSPDFHVARFSLITIVVATAALALLPRRASFPVIVVVAMNLAFSLMSGRNLPLFGIVVVPLVALEIERALLVWAPGRTRGAARAERGSGRLALGWPVIAAVAMFVLARLTSPTVEPPERFATRSDLFPTTFNPDVFPVRAVSAARAAHVTGRMFEEFTWGGYVLYAWPEQPVFIDGQTDFYGDSITWDYARIGTVDPGWRQELEKWRIDLALLATVSPLADALAHEAGWRPIYCDGTATLFQRDPGHPPALGPSQAVSASCTPFGIAPRTIAGPGAS
jgi:hypothetical protein